MGMDDYINTFFFCCCCVFTIFVFVPAAPNVCCVLLRSIVVWLCAMRVCFVCTQNHGAECVCTGKAVLFRSSSSGQFRHSVRSAGYTRNSAFCAESYHRSNQNHKKVTPLHAVHTHEIHRPCAHVHCDERFINIFQQWPWKYWNAAHGSARIFTYPYCVEYKPK